MFISVPKSGEGDGGPYTSAEVPSNDYQYKRQMHHFAAATGSGGSVPTTMLIGIVAVPDTPKGVSAMGKGEWSV